ncbi:MAG: hypothetical protein HC927_05565 [Deltaproteobacteria bacterium]|nr:hypothetical protein [Deltaproteobacteria bacterium]
MQFIREHTGRSIVHRVHSGNLVRSKKVRSQRGLRVLATEGRRIKVFELRGSLFFGTAEGVGNPVLYVGALGDPIVPERIVRPHLERVTEVVESRWIAWGGHVGFPRWIDLGMGGERGVLPQALAWVAKVGGR